MTFKTFMGSIGNAFKTGWNNGNIQKGISATGMAAFTVGMTGSMIHDMKHSGSIFGCGCNSFGFGGGMNMFGCNPMMMGGINMYSGMNMFGGMSMLNNMGTNPYNTQMGNMMAYQWGYNLALQQRAQNPQLYPQYSAYPQQELDPLDYEHGEAPGIPSGVTTEQGEAFDEAINGNGTVNIVEDITNGRTGDKQTYINKLSTLAQSHTKSIDEYGNNDGKVDFDEYFEKEKEGLQAAFPNSSEEQLKAFAERVFLQMDLNGDGNIDWQEMASSIATYDAGGSGTGGLDGKISTTDKSKAQRSLSSGTFGAANWAIYKTLFPGQVSGDE